LPADADRIFAASLADADADPAAAAATFRPAFAHLAMLVQIPGIDVAERAAAEKGSALTPAEEAILAERISAARAWLTTYAPDTARIAVLDRTAEPAAESAMRDLLAALADTLATAPSPWTGDQVQGAIFTAATERGVQAGSVFAALYAAFLGRTSGPRAGWLLASLDPAFVIGRLRQAAGSPSA
jgi:lysyl-tRNA synthetase class 1